MHELSIAESVVRIASDHAGGRSVAKVQLKVGHLRQVVPSALAFSFELLAEGTPLEGARLEIEDVPVVVVCLQCGAESEHAQFPLRCPRCASLGVDVVRGEELYVEALELEEGVAACG